MGNLLKDYVISCEYDEMKSNTSIRTPYKKIHEYFSQLSPEKLNQRSKFIEKTLHALGITYRVYKKNNDSTDRVLPLDLIPRVISLAEWNKIEKGLIQRTYAINLFLQDIYNERKVLNDKIIPEDMILGSKYYEKSCIGYTPSKKIWTHICGSDLIRIPSGEYAVLEDNLRCPSGVSYMLENREIIKRTLATLFEEMKVQTISDYPMMLYETLKYISNSSDPNIAVLTPGTYNSAYFEHDFIARKMGIQLVEANDLVIENNFLFMKTTKGLKRLHALYRRIDDEFIDPTVFNSESLLGVPGLFNCYKNHNLALANAIGTGVADDKSVYAYIPKIIKYFLNEEPILNNIETYLCRDKKQREYVLDNIKDLVVKSTNESGGYGMLIGPKSTTKEQEEFKDKIKKSPTEYIAQPTINFSQSPSFINKSIEGRHVDLRPYILYGEKINIIPGGLTRVALTRGSLVVNSSQGGGSKDTWVLGE